MVEELFALQACAFQLGEPTKENMIMGKQMKAQLDKLPIQNEDPKELLKDQLISLDGYTQFKEKSNT